MSQIQSDCVYTKDHEWLRVEGDTATVGITDFAQSQLGEVIYVELPEVGRTCTAQEVVATVESVKAASDVYAPVSGEVVAVNQPVADDPSIVNSSPFGDAWLVKIRMADAGEVEGLLNPEQYAELAKE